MRKFRKSLKNVQTNNQTDRQGRLRLGTRGVWGSGGATIKLKGFYCSLRSQAQRLSRVFSQTFIKNSPFPRCSTARFARRLNAHLGFLKLKVCKNFHQKSPTNKRDHNCSQRPSKTLMCVVIYREKVCISLRAPYPTSG